jgi:hypothetical protein
MKTLNKYSCLIISIAILQLCACGSINVIPPQDSQDEMNAVFPDDGEEGQIEEQEVIEYDEEFMDLIDEYKQDEMISDSDQKEAESVITDIDIFEDHAQDLQPDIEKDDDMDEDLIQEELITDIVKDLPFEILTDQLSDIVTDVPEEISTDESNDTEKDLIVETADKDIIEVGEDTVKDTGTDDDADTGCAPVNCDKYCKFGFKKDQNGCEVCYCADCADEQDCKEFMTCPDPLCTKQGFCQCQCNNTAGKLYECPDGTLVPFCECSILGYLCLPHPEYQCPTVCNPQQKVQLPCPDGTSVNYCTCSLLKCNPECQYIGTVNEGWYDSCSYGKIKIKQCKGCFAYCDALFTKSEGWYDSCTGDLITYDSCAPQFFCQELPASPCSSMKCLKGKTESYFCRNQSKVPFCECNVPDSECPPGCDKIGTQEEGWYDSCSGLLMKKEKCKDCLYKCDQIGTKSEGWYSLCAGLIQYANCATGTWKCLTNPWIQCKDVLQCSKESEEFNLTGNFALCCPGLTEIDKVNWDGKICSVPDCICRTCTYCGDGNCQKPENHCNCKEDCF